MDMQPRFVARGNAVAFCGRITRVGDRDVDQLIEIPGNSASLPVSGGLSRGDTGRVTLLHDDTWPAPIVSLGSGTTRTWDQGNEQAHVTHVMAAFDELAIAGRFFVGRAAAYLRSTYKEGADEPQIVVGESSITGLRCDEHLIQVKWRTEVVNRTPTFDTLRQAWGRSQDGEALRSSVLRQPSSARSDPNALPEMKGYVIVAVCELAWADQPHPEVTLDAHVIKWPGFGSVTVGEMLVSHHSRRLTLLRFDLGSPFAMKASAGEIESNGIGLP